MSVSAPSRLHLLIALSSAAIVLLPLWFLFDARLSGVSIALDRDGSGALDADEIGVRMAGRFLDADLDGSGSIDGAEFRRWLLGEWLAGRTKRLAVPEAPVDADAQTLRQWLHAPVAEGGLDGVGLLVLVDGEVVFEYAEGSIDPERPVPLGDLGTWPMAAVFACLDDRGELDLEAPLSARIERVPPAWADRSFAELLSHTAGAAGGAVPAIPASIEVATAGRDLANAFPPVSPGDQLRFGSASLQIAGWLAEEVTGRRWRRLFVECLAWPLSLDSAAWGHGSTGPSASGYVDFSSGLWMSPADYAVFLSMLQREGRYGGVANLRAPVLERMETDRAGTMPREALPAMIDPTWGHALGAWCERVDARGRCSVLSVVGAYGARAWIDRERDVAAVLVMVDALPRVGNWGGATRELVDRIYGRAIISGARGRPPGG